MTIHKKILYILAMVLTTLFLVGCGDKGTALETQSLEIATGDDSLYMIMEHDTSEESFILHSYETGKDYYVRYSFNTQFIDKYDNYTTASKFTEGRIVTVGGKNSDGYLISMQLSDQVWEYEKITRFSIDEERGVFTIANSNYSIQDEVMIFSNGKLINFSDLSDEDILKVVGLDKKILSIVVTTGNGTLSLKNTDLFEGSFLQLNSNIFLEITENIEVELHEGTYTLIVANDGWGGTTEIEIMRGETTEIDLDTLKGEGYKKGLVSFQIDVDNVSVYVDGGLVDHSQPIELTYGTHALEIEADGYDTWQKYLYVHSETATIVIELSDSEEETETETESETETTSESESESQTETETENVAE